MVGCGVGQYKDGQYICYSPLSVRTYTKFKIPNCLNHLKA